MWKSSLENVGLLYERVAKACEEKCMINDATLPAGIAHEANKHM